MQNKYFGDINDYHKYGLIRSLIGPTSFSVLIAWMLQPDDGSSDGKKLNYLEKPDEYRPHDPELFDFLRKTVLENGRREVAAIEETNLLPGASYFGRTLKIDESQRQEYFEELLTLEGDVVFYDPDQGLEIDSKDRGHKGSGKYLFFDEIRKTWSDGRSILTYHHFNRTMAWEKQTASRVRDLFQETQAPWVASFRASNTLFLLAPQVEHTASLQQGIEQVRADWGEEYKSVQIHPRDGGEE